MFKNVFIKIMTGGLIFLLVLAIGVYLFLQQKVFGKLPSGARLELIKKSPHYKNGSFQNISHTPVMTEGVSYPSMLIEFFFNKSKRVEPIGKIPSIKTDLLHLPKDSNILVWFGHSSYFMQIDGKTILVDPVFSAAATPLPFGTRAFNGTNAYSAADMPPIDYLFISHDHWDHLDYETILKLKPKIKTVITGLGTGAHFEHWGYQENQILERDWNQQISLEDGFTVNFVPARHFSGRGLQANKSLWVSFVLKTPTMKVFIGGDSGYDKHFREIGNRFGPFDLAIIENGQYNSKWRYIHLLPEEILQAAKELNALKIFPVHSSKFALGTHDWDEPLKKITENNLTAKLNIITPMIGEVVRLKDQSQEFSKWWETVE